MLFRGTRRRLVATSCAAAVSSLLALAIPSATVAAEKGVSVDLTWASADADKTRTQSALQDLGARWVRLTVNWNDAEPSMKGTYNAWWLAEYDKALSAARTAGARPLVVVSGTPKWANGGRADNVPPSRASDYADFLRFITARLGGRVDAWEVWNEQNTQRFWTGTVADYVVLLKAAYPVIKAGDPGSTVLLGGLSMSDWAWVRDAYGAGAKGSFDAMAVHPYTYCGSTGPDEVRSSGGRLSRDSFTAYREVRAEMVAAGDHDKGLWATEFGWNTSTKPCDPGAGYWTGGVSETAQAQYIRRAYEIFAEDPYVSVAVMYNARNNYWDADADDGEAQFGLMRTDFTPKQGYASFKAVGADVPSAPVAEPLPSNALAPVAEAPPPVVDAPPPPSTDTVQPSLVTTSPIVAPSPTPTTKPRKRTRLRSAATTTSAARLTAAGRSCVRRAVRSGRRGRSLTRAKRACTTKRRMTRATHG